MSSPLWDDLFARRPTRRGLIAGAVAGLVPAALPACSEVPPTPRAVKWGRDTCEFCHMVFADRRFAAEVWDRDTNRARIYDDFGCAVLASAENGRLDDATVPFWVTDDADPARWLDARTARYRNDVVTPMGYGHSAGPAADHPLAFAAAAEAIRTKAACEHQS